MSPAMVAERVTTGILGIADDRSGIVTKPKPLAFQKMYGRAEPLRLLPDGILIFAQKTRDHRRLPFFSQIYGEVFLGYRNNGDNQWLEAWREPLY